MENIDLLKLASEVSQENFRKNCVYNHKMSANSEIRTFALPQSGGGGTNPLVPPPPTFESGEACAPPPPPPAPFSYALEIDNNKIIGISIKENRSLPDAPFVSYQLYMCKRALFTLIYPAC